MFQGFIKNGEFYFYESGLRMGGEQYYIFTREMYGVSMLDLMIEFSITGKMESAEGINIETYAFEKSCCNYYITLTSGIIKSIEGIDEVAQMPQVLQVASFHAVGDEIRETYSLDRVIYRLHVMDNTKEKLAGTLKKISGTLRIISETGKEMQVEQLTYARAFEMIANS
jgi:biotin carboxylase